MCLGPGVCAGGKDEGTIPVLMHLEEVKYMQVRHFPPPVFLIVLPSIGYAWDSGVWLEGRLSLEQFRVARRPWWLLARTWQCFG